MDLVAVCVRKTAQNLHFLMQKKASWGHSGANPPNLQSAVISFEHT